MSRILARAAIAICLVECACGQLLGLDDPVDAPDAALDASAPDASAAEEGTSDAASEASPIDAADAPDVPACDPHADFTMPVRIEGTTLNTAANEGTPRLSPNELTLYFWSDRPTEAGTGQAHLYVATRARASDPFDPPRLLTELVSARTEASPTVSGDGLTIVFESDRLGGVNGQLFGATRSDPGQSFTNVLHLANVNDSSNDATPYLLPDGSILYFTSDRPNGVNGQDIYRAARQPDGTFGAPEDVPELNSTDDEFSPTLLQDETIVFWGTNRKDKTNAGAYDIFTASRTNTSEAFTGIQNVGILNSPAIDIPGWLSPDGCRLYLESARPGGFGGTDIFVARRGK